MYYKIENKECDVYAELHALRTYEKQIEKENIEAIAEKVGLEWEMEFGHIGQQNFIRVSSLMGFGFLETEKVDLKIWKQHKEHKDIFVPNTKTKLGREMQEFLSNGLKKSRYDKVLKILKLEELRKFTFPFVEIEKRKKYSESRSKNRKNKNKQTSTDNNICKTYVNHMENEIEIEIEDVNDTKNDIVIKNSLKVKKPEINFEEIITIFNSVCVEVPRVTKIIESRKKAIIKILENNTLEEIGQVFRNVAESDYLNGKIVSWRADFDWIMKPDNFVKILENNYKNKNNGKTTAKKSNVEYSEDFLGKHLKNLQS